MEDKLLASLETHIANAANSVRVALECCDRGDPEEAAGSLVCVQSTLRDAANLIAEQRAKDRPQDRLSVADMREVFDKFALTDEERRGAGNRLTRMDAIKAYRYRTGCDLRTVVQLFRKEVPTYLDGGLSFRNAF